MKYLICVVATLLVLLGSCNNDDAAQAEPAACKAFVDQLRALGVHVQYPYGDSDDCFVVSEILYKSQVHKLLDEWATAGKLRHEPVHYDPPGASCRVCIH